MQIKCGANQAGQKIVQIELAEVADPVALMRALKQAFAQEWAAVNLEITVAQPKLNGVNRLLNAEGK